jgi:hypothetical protein
MNSVIDDVDYGPLAQLLGKWVGNKGLDNAPDAAANSDITDFTDEINFTIAGPAENAEEQELVAIKYHHVVRKLENGLIFHDQIGHWIYEPSTNNIMHSLSIPRAVCLLAGGKYKESNGEGIFNVEAKQGSDTFGIVQSPFMIDKAKTTAFRMELSVKNNELKYCEITSLKINGKTFEHSNERILHRVTYD